MEIWEHVFLPLLGAVVGIFASSGFWMFVLAKNNKRTAADDMLLGLGHDRIVYLCLKYIGRGWISQDEFENLNEYLYTPYLALGGNGSAKKLMDEVIRLPMKSPRSDTGELR